MGAVQPVRQSAPLVPITSRRVRPRPTDASDGALRPAFGAVLQGHVEQADAGPGESRLNVILKLPPGSSLSTEDQIEAERRYRIIEPIRQAKGQERADLIRSAIATHGLSRSTVYAWLETFEGQGMLGLVRRQRADKGDPRRINSAALDFIVSAVLPKPGEYGELSIAEIHRAYEEERAWRAAHTGKALTGLHLAEYARYIDPATGHLKATAQLPKISSETIRVWLHRFPEPVKTLAREAPDAYQNTQEILSYRDLAALHPLDFVVMDHRMLDVVVMSRASHGWRLVRPWVTAAIDLRTRKWLRFAIVEIPSSTSIVSVLKGVFLDFGIPRALLYDNGRDFTCQYLEGRQIRSRKAGPVGELGDGVRGVLETLDCRVHHAIVRRARSKIIEANFVALANFERGLPWWCGHTPKSRPARFDELLERHERWMKGELKDPVFPLIEEVAALYDDLLAELNEREHCGGEGMQKVTPTGRGWMSPAECWERLIGAVERRTVPADVLGFCFQKRRKLTVRHGELQASFHGRLCHYRLLDSQIRLMELNGREVELAYDPLDLETAAVYTATDGRFIGLANCIELRRMGENAFVADERARRAAKREIKKLIASVHKAVYVPGPLERLDRRRPIRPVRKDPARAEVCVNVPAALVEAAQAAESEKAFSFAASAVDPKLISESPPPASQDDGSDVFQFFSKDADG